MPNASSQPKDGKSEMTETVDLRTIAFHEAGHAVMRWLRGLPATELTADCDGGFCAGTGTTVRADDELFVALAGFAAEGIFGSGDVDWEACRGDDFDYAREILAARPFMRPNGMENALNNYFNYGCDLLRGHLDLIDTIASRLEHAGRLSARQVAALCRRHQRGAPLPLQNHTAGTGCDFRKAGNV